METSTTSRTDRLYLFQSSHGVTAFVLKIAAIIGMTANHVANVFSTFLPEPLTLALYALGGITFPTFAFLLIEGYIHTSNLRRYFERLFIFALVSQIPFTLLWGLEGNVMFTIFIGLAIVYLFNRFGATVWTALVLIAAIIVTGPYFDWGGIGIVLIFLFYFLRMKSFHLGRWSIVIVIAIVVVYNGFPFVVQLLSFGPFDVNTLADGYMGHANNSIADAGYGMMLLAGTLYFLVGCSIALGFLVAYNGKQGPHMKWFFYAYYPGHLFVIWLISLLV